MAQSMQCELGKKVDSNLASLGRNRESIKGIKMQKFYMTAVVAIGAVMLIGCDQKTTFSGTPQSLSSVQTDPADPGAPAPAPVDPPPPRPPICEVGERPVAKPTKVIFVVDQSDSNVTGPAEHDGHATDKHKGLRYAAMSELLSQHGGKNHLEWSLITFQMYSATAITNVDGDTAKPKFVSGDKMGKALSEFMSIPDGGATPYLEAIKMVHTLIRKDLKAGGEPSAYRVAFLTDGYPTDSSDVTRLNRKIFEALDGLMALAPDAIQFNTVYYGFPDEAASDRLKKMAKIGNGGFVDASNSQDIHLNDVIKVPTTNCRVP